MVFAQVIIFDFGHSFYMFRCRENFKNACCSALSELSVLNTREWVVYQVVSL